MVAKSELAAEWVDFLFDFFFWNGGKLGGWRFSGWLGFWCEYFIVED